MIAAFRFLAPGRWDPLAGIRWTTSWTARAAGLLAHPATALHHWLTAELWRVELDGPIEQRWQSMVAGRARLVEPVAVWDRQASAAFIDSCRERHPNLITTAATASWCAPCTAGYEAAQYAGMSAAERGGDYATAEDAERALQLEWVLARTGLSDRVV